MRNRLIPVVVVLGAAVAALSWALVYFAKDEWKLVIGAGDENVTTRSLARQSEGHAAVELSAAAQRASGVVTQSLQASQSNRSTEVLGAVVNLQPLLEARSRLLTLLGEAAAARASVRALRIDHQRLQTLYADDRNVSERAVLAAQTQLRAEEARVAASEQSIAGQREAMRLAWGKTLASSQSRVIDGLLAGREVLIQFSLPVEVTAADLRLGSQRLRFISPAPTTDGLLPGATYFYSAAADGLRVGMRVIAQLHAAGSAREGVIVPLAAVIWHSGKAWVYTKDADEDDLFVRREISTSEEMGDGFFNVVDWDDVEVVVSGAQLLLSEELKFQIRNENED